MSASNNPFPPDVIDAVRRHMNDDHAADTLVMCRGVGGHPDATAAEMTGMDGEAGIYRLTLPEGEKTIRIPWERPLTQRAEVRPEVVRIYTESCAILGLEPPTSH
ncbi:DUF2470 domain-containing protein [Natronoglycomyces albus]|uniref:DUF2470 domain-containing protein n=1 Tax=Natronoglycomyces albus TaxID=2811108 RepID=A0A895XNV1_9ACTN|nr:DUF2470 domain-containing protein [Natronoglycomyces albus]QSB04745.1 DUF2470 domain-containing protein [Natronoglycomyces albus]